MVKLVLLYVMVKRHLSLCLTTAALFLCEQILYTHNRTD